MDFEGIEKVRQRVRRNGTLAGQLLQLQQQYARLAAVHGAPGTGGATVAGALTKDLPVAAAARAMNSQQ